jgi:uncharacterized protein YbjT (DUF2867 family)
MADKKVIAVLGATGAQGGGLASAILNDSSSEFTVRALTRNINSEKAKVLERKGAEVVAVDIDDHDELIKAFDGAYGVYAVTFFWEHFSPEKEMEHAESIAKAAKQTGVSHVIWSTLEDTRKYIPLDDNRMPTLGGKYKVPHFDAKGESNKFFTELGVPTTLLNTSFYWDNLIHFGMNPKRGEDGKLAFVMPMGDKKLPGIASEDIGKCAYGIFKAGSKYIGETLGIAGEHASGTEMADVLSKALGEKVNYRPVSFDVFRSFDFPGADDLGNMFQFKHDFEDQFRGARSINLSRELNPELKSFADWAMENKNRIPKE